MKTELSAPNAVPEITLSLRRRPAETDLQYYARILRPSAKGAAVLAAPFPAPKEEGPAVTEEQRRATLERAWSRLRPPARKATR